MYMYMYYMCVYMIHTCKCTHMYVPHVCRKYSFFVVDNAWWYSKCGILHLSQLIQAVFLCSRISSTLHLYVLVIRSQPVCTCRTVPKVHKKQNLFVTLHVCTCILYMYIHVHVCCIHVHMDITVTTCGVRTQGQPKETIVVMTGDVAVFRAMPQ